MDPKIITSFDLTSGALLPHDWREQIRSIVLAVSQKVVMSGESVTSRDVSGSATEYRVVTGDAIRERLRWLWDLYANDFVKLATDVAGRPMKSSKYVKSAITLNVLEGLNARYEWHVDNNPLTGLLYVNTLTSQDGGELVFKVGKKRLYVSPRCGELIFFDARELPHAVLPLKRDIDRISIPMNFFFLDENEVRPADLDSHIFGIEA